MTTTLTTTMRRVASRARRTARAMARRMRGAERRLEAMAQHAPRTTAMMHYTTYRYAYASNGSRSSPRLATG